MSKLFFLIFLLASTASAHQVETVSTINEPESFFQATSASDNEVLYVWGGNAFSQSTPGTVESFLVNSGRTYDPATDIWKTMSTTNAPTPRRLAFSFVVDGKFVVWGGCTSSYIINSCDKIAFDGGVYDLKTDSWKKIPEPPSVDCEQITSTRPNAAFIHNKKLTLTNCSWSDKNDQFVYQFDFLSQSWAKVDLSKGKGLLNWPDWHYNSRVQSANIIFQWGPFTNSMNFKSYDLLTDTTTDIPLATFSIDRNGTPVVHNDKIVFVGGGFSLADADVVRASSYDIKTGEWNVLPSFPRRSGVKLLSHKGHVLAWGGRVQTSIGTNIATFEEFDDLSILSDGDKNWHVILPSTAKVGVTVSRKNAYFASAGDWVIIWGGYFSLWGMDAPAGIRIKIEQ